MNRILVAALAALLLSGCATTVASGAAPTSGPATTSPAASRAEAPAARDDEPAPVSSYSLQTTLIIEKDGSSRFTREERFVVLSASPPRYFAQLDAEFDPALDERPELFAEVRLPDGTVKQLDPATIAEAPVEGSSADNFTDRRRLVAPIPALVPGSSVVRRSTRITKRPLGNFGQAWSLQMATGMLSDSVTAIVEYPADLEPSMMPFNFRGLPKREELEGKVRITYTASKVAAVDAPDSLPPEQRRYPELYVSTAHTWQEVAHGYLALVKPALDPAPLKALAAELKPASNAARDVAAAALDWMHHNLRYTGLDFANAGVVPHTAAETLQRGYGDCKDLAAFLVALLDAAGVKANMALVLASPWSEGPEEAPGLGRFNHVIVYVPGSEPLWIDPTMRGSEPGHLSDLTTARNVLLVDAGEKVRLRTPDGSIDANRAVIQTEITLPETGRGTITTSRKLGGSAIAWRRYRAIWQSADQVQRNVGNAVEKVDDTKDFTYQHSDPLSARGPFEETQVIRRSKRALAADSDAVAPLGFDAILEILPDELQDESAKDDEHDLFVGVPRELEMVTRVHTHALYRLRSGAVTQEGHAGGIRWSYVVEPRDDGAEARLHLRLENRVIQSEDLAAVRETLKQLFRVDNQVEFDNRVFRLTQQGQFFEAAQELRKLAKAEPKSAWIRALQARVALGAGLGKEGHRLAKEAQKLAPDSLPVLRTLAWILAHDEWGNGYAKGMDRKGALAALARARKLDPDEKTLHQQQLELLARNDDGEIAGKGADVKKALEELRTYRGKGHTDEDRLYLDLLWSEGLDAELIEAKAKYPADSKILAAIARSKGADEAMAWIERQDGSKGEAYLAATTLELYKVREYALAHTLASKVRDPRMAVMTQMLSNLRKREEVQVDLEKPVDVIVESTAHALGARVRTTATQLGLTEEMTKALGVIAKGQIDKLPGAAEAVLDSVPNSVRIDQQEVPGIGVLAVMHAPGRPDTVLLFEHTKQGLHFHPADTEAARLELAWKAWEAGDLDKARAWLDVHLRVGGEARDREGLIRARMKGDREDVAIAIVLATGEMKPQLARLMPHLEKAWKERSKHQESVQLAGLWLAALLTAERYDDALAQVETIESEGLLPRPELADQLRKDVLYMAKRPEQLEALGRSVLEKEPTSEVGYQMLLGAAMLRKDRPGYREICLRMVDAGVMVDTALNNSAWYSLYTGVGDEDIRRAERAIGPKADRPSAIDTLAVLLAEKGQVDRALRTLDQLERVTGKTVPDSGSVIYARARIAEDLGFTEAARELYGKVPVNEKPDDDLSPFAKKRLAAMAAK